MLWLLSQISIRDILVSGGTLALAGVIAFGANKIENRWVSHQAAVAERQVWQEAVNKIKLLLQAEREAAQAKLDELARKNAVKEEEYRKKVEILNSEFDKELERYEKDLAEARKRDSNVIIPRSLRDKINAAGR